MVDLTFLSTFKGVLYPLKLQPSIEKDSSKACDVCDRGEFGRRIKDSQAEVLPLSYLCCKKIVMDGQSTSQALEVVPNQLYYDLMKAALLNTRDCAIKHLMSKWPWKVLKLSKFVDYMFNDLRTLYSDSYVGENMRRGVKYTTCLAHTFVECLKNRSPTKLKYLDLTGYPAAEVIVNYLASYVMLVSNESQQQKIISVYNEVVENLPESETRKYELESTLPDDCYVIRLDAFVLSADSHMELCRALKLSLHEPCRFKLQLCRLSATCLGVVRLSVLLELIDPTYLTGLCIHYNALCCEGLNVLAPRIAKLTSLTGLDLSCNNIGLASIHEIAEHLGKTLGKLINLTRLNMSNNRIKNKLREVLRYMENPLKHLELSACGLSGMDLVYLASSNHAKHLEALDLSENNLSKCFDKLCALLTETGKQLLTLELEDCRLDQHSCTQLFYITSKSLKALRFWNISRNLAPATTETFFHDIKPITHMLNLRTFLISYPVDLIDIEGHVSELEALSFRRRLHNTLNKILELSCRPALNVILV